MDSADQDPPSSRPKRDLRLPEHLAEYDVVLLPSQQPAAQVSSLPVGQPGKRKSSRTGSASGYQSSTSSRRSSHLSLGSQLLKNMPDVKAAALEEQIRVMELADLQQEIEEEREADLEAKKLEEQVKEGQRMQEEAYLAKERMAKEMGRRRRLKKLEKEIKIASAVKCFLSESEDEAKDRLFHLPMLLSIQHSHSSTQIRQLVQSELGSILNSPAIKSGDAEAFDSFALSVQSLVGMLRTLEGTVGYELRCGSHVDRLLSKMSPAHRDGFVEYCLCRGILQPGHGADSRWRLSLSLICDRGAGIKVARWSVPLFLPPSHTDVQGPPSAASATVRAFSSLRSDLVLRHFKLPFEVSSRPRTQMKEVPSSNGSSGDRKQS
uniref:Uncharacterized protein n=1 Tax=Knipowitschia caucasica TaxID=637954 RepID=A0AAV2KV07_KNICA